MVLVLYTLYLLAAKVVGTSMDPLVVSSIHPHEFLFLVPTSDYFLFSNHDFLSRGFLLFRIGQGPGIGVIERSGSGNDKESFNQQIK